MSISSKQDIQEESSTSTTPKTEKAEISNKYTQREWDRVVGIGKVPPEYKRNPDETFKDRT